MDLTIENFKGIKRFEYRDFKPLTILSGINSGGKTSLIQSVLLLKQSMEFGNQDMPVVLNGKYTRLGSIDNVVHRGQSEISIGITIKSHPKINRICSRKIQIANYILQRDNSGNNSRKSITADSVSYKLTFGERNQSDIPRIKELTLTIRDSTGFNHILVLTNSRTNSYRIKTNSILFVQLPFNVPPKLLKNLVTSEDKLFTNQNNDLLSALLENNDETKLFQLDNQNFVFNNLKICPVSEEDDFYHRKLTMNISKLDVALSNELISKSLDTFSNINFIGPLREEPRTLYFKETDIIDDIGIRGENAGFLFAKNNSQLVFCPKIDKKALTITSEEMKLEDAINYWMNEQFHLAKSLTVNKYKNNNIYEIEVINYQNIKTSISSVGFGISQIFPIMVSSLLSDEDSLLILEQPEIHLHPAVQSLLFDFLYGLSYISPNKKILVETHSDHLINKYRIFKIKQSNHVDEETAVFFTNPDESTLQKVEFDNFGNLSQWPQGFFDQSAIDNKTIFEMQLNKRLNSYDHSSEKDRM